MKLMNAIQINLSLQWKSLAHIYRKVYNGKDNELKFRECIWPKCALAS